MVCFLELIKVPSLFLVRVDRHISAVSGETPQARSLADCSLVVAICTFIFCWVYSGLLSTACAGEFDDVVGLESVDGTVVGVGEFFGERLLGEVCGEVSATAPLGPYLVSCMKKLSDEAFAVLPEESLCLQSDVVEADIGGAAAVESIVFLDSGAVVVGVAVEVVVDGVVVDHLGDGDIEEEVGVLCPAQIFGEDLHQECLAYTFVATDKERFGEFAALGGEDVFGEGAVVEVVEQKGDDLSVAVVDDELASLRGEDDVVCHAAEEVIVHAEHGGIG